MNHKIYVTLTAVVLAIMTSNLQAQQPVPATATSITVNEMHCEGCVQKMAAQLYTIRGVKEVQVDFKGKTMFVVPQKSVVVSPKAMWEAIIKAKKVPLRLAGPNGTFTQKPKF